MIDKFFRIFTPIMFGYLIGNLHVKFQIKKHMYNPIYDDD